MEASFEEDLLPSAAEEPGAEATFEPLAFFEADLEEDLEAEEEEAASDVFEELFLLLEVPLLLPPPPTAPPSEVFDFSLYVEPEGISFDWLASFELAAEDALLLLFFLEADKEDDEDEWLLLFFFSDFTFLAAASADFGFASFFFCFSLALLKDLSFAFFLSSLDFFVFFSDTDLPAFLAASPGFFGIEQASATLTITPMGFWPGISFERFVTSVSIEW